MSRLPFEVTGPQKGVTLTRSSFTSAATPATFPGANLLNLLTPVAYRDVPLGTILSLRGGVPFRLYIKGLIYYPSPALGAPLNFDLTNLGASWTRSTRQGPAFPNASHPDIHALAFSTTTGLYTPVTITAFDFNTGLGSLTVPGGLGNISIWLYYLTANGEMEFRASRPVGSDGVAAKLYGSPFRALHETDQNNVRTAPTFGEQGANNRYNLPEQWRLTLNVRSAETIDWRPEANHELVIAADTLSIRVTDPARMAATAEVMLRGGTI